MARSRRIVDCRTALNHLLSTINYHVCPRFPRRPRAHRMAKSAPPLDVLVLGQHPCAYLAADVLATGKPPLSVAHATIPGDNPPDRLVLVNPHLFALHKPLEKVRKKLELNPLWGAMFLSDDA